MATSPSTQQIGQQLFEAAKVGDVALCDSILRAYGASAAVVSFAHEGSYTPLHAAARNGHVEAVQLLLSYGADPARRTDYGKSPFDLACKQGHAQVQAVLRPVQGALALEQERERDLQEREQELQRQEKKEQRNRQKLAARRLREEQMARKEALAAEERRKRQNVVSKVLMLRRRGLLRGAGKQTWKERFLLLNDAGLTVYRGMERVGTGHGLGFTGACDRMALTQLRAIRTDVSTFEVGGARHRAEGGFELHAEATAVAGALDTAETIVWRLNVISTEGLAPKKARDKLIAAIAERCPEHVQMLQHDL